MLLERAVDGSTSRPVGNASQEAPGAPHGVYPCAGDDRWLVATFAAVSDLHDLVVTTHDVSRLRFRVQPYPVTVRGNEAYFRALGFSNEDVEGIRRFFDIYRQVTGRDFEAATRG